jgi:hypothetical protein
MHHVHHHQHQHQLSTTEAAAHQTKQRRQATRLQGGKTFAATHHAWSAALSCL